PACKNRHTNCTGKEIVSRKAPHCSAFTQTPAEHASKRDTMAPSGTIAASGGPKAPIAARVDWVDYAKGICIVMVVMMHSVLGVELAAGETGFMHWLVMFAKPFRMPDFFLISGLFLSVVIDRDWRTYFDRKVLHFSYFYLL